MHTRSTPYYLNHIDRGIHLYWRTLGKARGMVTHRGDIEYVMSSPRGGPERVYRVRLEAGTAEARVDQIAARIRAGEIPNGLLLGPGTTPPDLAEILSHKGFTLDTAAPCMALDLADFYPEPPRTEAITTEAVTSADQLSVWGAIVNRGLFGCELFSREQYADLYHLETTRFYLGSIDGVLASTTMTLHDGDTATIEMVATLPEQRKKGLGAATVTAALCDLRDQGVETVTLRAETDGVNLYKRLGFQVICQRVVASLGGA